MELFYLNIEWSLVSMVILRRLLWFISGGVGGDVEKEFIGYLIFYIFFVKLIDM